MQGVSSQDMDWQCYYGKQRYSAIGCVQGVSSQDIRRLAVLLWHTGILCHRVWGYSAIGCVQGVSSQDMDWQCYYGTQIYSTIRCVQGVSSQDMDWQCYYETQGYSAILGQCHHRTWNGSVTMRHKDTLP